MYFDNPIASLGYRRLILPSFHLSMYTQQIRMTKILTKMYWKTMTFFTKSSHVFAYYKEIHYFSVLWKKNYMNKLADNIYFHKEFLTWFLTS